MKEINHKGIITAHSGCDGTPDNSLEFVRYALAHNCDCFEVDIRKVNGILILSHNDVEEGMEPVRLEEVFELMVGHDSQINCDLKEPGLEEDVFALAGKVGVQDKLIFTGTVNIEKFRIPTDMTRKVDAYINVESISRYIEHIYEGKTLPEHPRVLEELMMVCEKVSDYQIAGININYHLCDEDALEYFRAVNMPVSVWTVNEESDARPLLRARVKNVTTRKLAFLTELKERSV